MDELLSMALWIMVAFMTVSASVVWFNSQSDISSFNLGLQGYTDNPLVNSNNSNLTCQMNSWIEFPPYALCFINQLTSPITSLVDSIWKLLTSWINLLHAIFGYNQQTHTYLVPGGGLFVGLIVPFLTIIEVGAAIVILMRLAAIIRGVAGGFL